MAKYLPTDTTDDSEGVSTLRTVDIEVIAGSDMPTRATAGSAAYDLKAGATVVIPPHSTGTVPLNLRLNLNSDHFMLLLSRSGLATRGLTVEGGVIDSDYHEIIKVILRTSSPIPFKVQKGQRITQAVFLPVVQADFKAVEVFENKDEIEEHLGFGSTGL